MREKIIGKKKEIFKVWPYLLVIFLPVIVVSIIYFWHFGGTNLAEDVFSPNGDSLIFDARAIFGQFGDYFGGVLNPILTAINVFLLIYFHKEILLTTTKNFSLSEDKDQIFKLIENHHYILRSLMAKDDEGEIHRGIDTFWLFRGMLEKGYKIQSRNTEEKKENVKGAEEKKNGKDINSLKKSYNFIYKEQQQRQYLGHYFRNLFHIFKFIDESQFNEKEKSEYAEIVRAQLSYLELHFLFLNCLIEEGEDFRQYVTKFELLKELEYFEFNPKSKKDNINPIRIEISPTIETWKKETPCPNVPT